VVLSSGLEIVSCSLSIHDLINCNDNLIANAVVECFQNIENQST
jgi:hypothetical protein